MGFPTYKGSCLLLLTEDFMESIIVKCKGADTLPIDRIVEFQGELKKAVEGKREQATKFYLEAWVHSTIFCMG